MNVVFMFPLCWHFSTEGFFCLFNNTWQMNRLFCTWQPETPMKTRSSVFVTSPGSSPRWTESSSLMGWITLWLIHGFVCVSDHLPLMVFLREKVKRLVVLKSMARLHSPCRTSAFLCLWEGCLFSGVVINPLFDMLHWLWIHTGRKPLTFFFHLTPNVVTSWDRSFFQPVHTVCKRIVSHTSKF